jgi:Cytosol aminopeptidase family, N-terminal domain
MGFSSPQQVASPPDQIEAEAVAALFFPEDRPLAGAAGLFDWRLNGFLTNLILVGKAHGSYGEQLWVQANGKLKAPWVLFIGGGKRAELADTGRYRQTMSHLMTIAMRSGVKRLVIGLDPDLQSNQGAALKLVSDAWSDLGPQKPQCLVTFDQSWINR